MAVIVGKYGGGSTTCPEDLLIQKRITEDNSMRKVMVKSARRGVTSLLRELSESEDMSIVDKLVTDAPTVYEGVPERAYGKLRKDLEDRLKSQMNRDARKDLIAAWGEYECSYMTAKILGYEFVDSRDIIKVTGRFGDAKVLESCYSLIRSRLSGRGPYVVTGYYGSMEDGSIATLDRGGSDTTAAHIAAALDADVYENWTDRNGVMRADPGVVADASTIKEATFAEMRDLAYSGFKILHAEAVRPVAVRRIPIHIRRAREYPREGTWVTTERICPPEEPFVGVAYRGDFCAFHIQPKREASFSEIARLFEDREISIEFMPGTVRDLSVIIRQEELDGAHDTKDIASELRSMTGRGSVKVDNNLGCMVVAGKGLAGYAHPINTAAFKNRFSAFLVDAYGLNEEIGLFRRIAEVFEKENVPIQSMPSTIDDVSIVVNQKDLSGGHVIGGIIRGLYSVIGEHGRVTLEDKIDHALIGKGILRPGISADIQRSLSDAGISTQLQFQGATMRCYAYIIQASQGKKAVETIYRNYLAPKTG
jgi:aspartate kinase